MCYLMVILSYVHTRDLDTHQKVLFVLRQRNKEYLPLPALSLPPPTSLEKWYEVAIFQCPSQSML